MRFGRRPMALLKILDPAQVAALRGIGTVQTHRKNAVIYELGSPAESVHVVVSGRVRLRDHDRDGRDITVAFAAAGEMFGVEAMARLGRRAMSSTAAEKSEVLTIQAERLRDLMARDSGLATQLIQHISDLSVHAEERVKMLAFLDVPSRLAGTLLWLADRYAVHSTDGLEVPYWFTHQELADLIGSTRETVTTVLAEFRRQGLVTSREHHFVIQDRGALERRLGVPEFGRV